MKIENKYEEAFVSKSLETFSATISITPEMFDLMMSGVYKDKLAAPSRELICNARDSHVEAGVSLPVKIHAPTLLEPWFSVQDFGLGMSAEMMTHTYMCLGSSTKRDSNELIGAKGIGSKSPFALVEGFQVISIFNGIQTSYSVFKNKGLPQVAPVHEKETSDHNGVEVKFSIDPGMIGKFNDALVNFLRYFDYPVDCNIDITNQKEVAYSSVFEDFKVEILQGNKVKSRVVMGGVPYASTYLNLRYGKDNIIVTVPIGACDIDPGRENTVENHTTEAFSDKLRLVVESVEKEYYDKIKLELDQFTKLSDCAEWFNQLSNSAKTVATLVINKTLSIDKDKLPFYKANSFRSEKAIPSIFNVLEGGTIFMVKDKPSMLMRRAKKLLEDNNKGICFVIGEKNDAISNPLFEGMIYRASDVIFPKAEKVKRSKVLAGGSRKGHRVFTIRKGQSGFSLEQVSKEDISKSQSWLIRGSIINGNHGKIVGVHGEGFQTFCEGNNYDEILENGNTEEIFLLTEYQSKWVDESNKFKIKVDTDLKRILVRSLVRQKDYNEDVEKVNAYRGVLGVQGRLKPVERTYRPSWLPSQVAEKITKENNLRAVAEERMNRVSKEKGALEKEIDQKFPLLKKLKNIDYTDKHVKHYIRAVQALNLVEGK